jgi:hypothetical protein
MAQVSLDGTVTIGPQSSSGGGVPAAINSVAFSTTPSPKPAQVYIETTRNVQSPSAYVELTGIGTTDTITRANFLYFKAASPVMLRLTMVDTPSDIVAEEWVSGVIVHEFPDDHALKLLEVKGSGTVEYMASGNS